jgi:hypothetical protein
MDHPQPLGLVPELFNPQWRSLLVLVQQKRLSRQHLLSSNLTGLGMTSVRKQSSLFILTGDGSFQIPRFLPHLAVSMFSQCCTHQKLGLEDFH